MKHKYHDVIVAWAEGKPIQSRAVGRDRARGPWKDFQGNSDFTPHFHRIDIEWRVKPEKKVIWIKVVQVHATNLTPLVFYSVNQKNKTRIDRENSHYIVLRDWTPLEYEDK